MRAGDALTRLAARFGILASYRDFDNQLIETSPQTQKAILRANGLSIDTDKMTKELLAELEAADNGRILPQEIIIESGNASKMQPGFTQDWHITLEGEDEIYCQGRGGDPVILPALPSGIHQFGLESGGETSVLICHPGRAPSIKSLGGASQIWGLNAALYGLRSKRNQGLGDFDDLARLSQISADAGANFIGINPVHSIGFNDTTTISPYSPSHRGFLNIEHIAVERIGELEGMPNNEEISGALDGQLIALRNCQLVDYHGHRKRHHGQLEALFRQFNQQAGSTVLNKFREFCKNRGSYLETFALFEAISAEFGTDWRQWPPALRNQERSAIASIKSRLSHEILLHHWLQWVADEQIAAVQNRAKSCGMALGLYLDLAVGARRGGAESWCEAATIGYGVSLGAPPDQLNPHGQNWNINAYAPPKLAKDRYRALRRIYREAMRHCGILRIDHALGLNRSFWIPDDGSAGGYIKQPFEAMLAIIAIEAQAAQCAIIGEDLGLVPEGFRHDLQLKGIYGYSVLQYEKGENGEFTRPADLRSNSLACFGTHDTATLKGYWQGHDIDVWQSMGFLDDRHAAKSRNQRQVDIGALMAIGQQEKQGKIARATKFKDIYNAIHKALAGSAAAMVSVQLDDVLGQREAQNYPGTIDEQPNWRRRCLKTLDELENEAVLSELGEFMSDHGRGSKRSAIRPEVRKV